MSLNVGNASYNMTSPVAPPEPPRDARRNEPSRPDEVDDRADRDFERKLQEELKGRQQQQAPVLPLPLPWLLNQTQHPPAEAERTIEAATGVVSAGTRPTPPSPWLAAPVIAASTPAPSFAVEGELQVAPVQAPEHDATQPVQVMVEAGLPIVQPQTALPVGEAQHVHVADFPQVVNGTVRQMVKDNQPLTQLDFEISPPHIGPVNLQVQLQNGAVNVQLVALTVQAKQALESQVNNITSILQAHSFTPGQIKVVTAAGGKTGAGSTGQKGDQPQGFGLLNGGRRRSQAESDSMSVGQA